MAKKMLKHLEIIYRQVESKISASCKEYLQRDNGKLGVGMRTLYETMQCNGKLYNVHGILSLFCDFDFDLIFFFLLIF